MSICTVLLLYTLKNCHDAEDVVADAVADAYNGISSLREADAFKNWIFKILSNKCRRRLKEYTRKTSELPDDLEKERGFHGRISGAAGVFQTV